LKNKILCHVSQRGYGIIHQTENISIKHNPEEASAAENGKKLFKKDDVVRLYAGRRSWGGSLKENLHRKSRQIARLKTKKCCGPKEKMHEDTSFVSIVVICCEGLSSCWVIRDSYLSKI